MDDAKRERMRRFVKRGTIGVAGLSMMLLPVYNSSQALEATSCKCSNICELNSLLQGSKACLKVFNDAWASYPGNAPFTTADAGAIQGKCGAAYRTALSGLTPDNSGSRVTNSCSTAVNPNASQCIAELAEIHEQVHAQRCEAIHANMPDNWLWLCLSTGQCDYNTQGSLQDFISDEINAYSTHIPVAESTLNKLIASCPKVDIGRECTSGSANGHSLDSSFYDTVRDYLGW